MIIQNPTGKKEKEKKNPNGSPEPFYPEAHPCRNKASVEKALKDPHLRAEKV